MKECTVCKIVKPLEDFGKKASSKKDGRTSFCRVCKAHKDKEYCAIQQNKEKRNLNRKQYYEANKDKLDKYREDWRRINKEKKKEYDKIYRLANKERIKEAKKAQHDPLRIRERQLKRKYNISLDDYKKMLLEQDNKCWTCSKKAEDETGKGLVVDHNHSTGQVRGLLCSKCNTAIGLLQENPVILQKVSKYLQEKGSCFSNEDKC